MRNSALFDQNYYLAANPDVKALRFDPVVHYLRFGSSEGRSPSPYFSELNYRKLYPDVASEAISAVEHYERYGRSEGRLLFKRRPCPETHRVEPVGRHVEKSSGASENLRRRLELSGLFDPSTYIEMHPDLKFSGRDPWEHFLDAGLKEGRRFTTSELFARALSRLNPESQDALWAVRQALAAQSGDDNIRAAAAPVASSCARIGVFCSSHGNFFMQEIANLVHWQLSALNFDSQLRTEESDRAEAFDIRIFVAPHEFFWLGQGENWRHLGQAPGTVLFNVEQVQTAWFCKGLPFLLEAPLVLDINFQSAILLRRMGCNAIH